MKYIKLIFILGAVIGAVMFIRTLAGANCDKSAVQTHNKRCNQFEYIDPTLNLNNASFTFNLILSRPQNTLQLVSATDTATSLFINQHLRFVLNIPAQNGGASSTVDTLTPGASALSPWTATVPGTFPSGTYNYMMFLGIECYNNCTVSSTVATGTFTIN